MSNESKASKGLPPQELLTALNIGPNDWDVIIVGDGSGSRWGYPGGWAAVIFDRRTGMRKLLFGALSDTTINICELSPYIYAMQWYVRGPGKELQRELRQNGYPRSVRVFVVTDCEIVAKQGRRDADRDANGALWAAMDAYGMLNYAIDYRYHPRDLLAANRACDALSKGMRKLITSIENTTDQYLLLDPYDDQYGQAVPEQK